METQSTIAPKHWVMLMALSLTWGSSFVAVDIARNEFSPISIAFFRIFIGAVIVSLFITIQKRRLPLPSSADGRRFWIFAILMGFFSNAYPFTVISWAIGYVSSSFAGLTMATVPLVVLPLAHFLIPGDQMTPRKTIGFFIGFVGTVILIDPFADGMLAIGLPELALISAAASYAVGSIITRFSPAGSPVRMAAGALIAGAAMMVPFLIFGDVLPDEWALIPTLGVIHLGLFSTGIATILIVITVREAGPSFLSLSNYLVPIWAVIFGATILNETIPVRFFIALGFIFVGIAITRRKKSQH